MDVLNFNSMINHCIQKMIINRNGQLTYYRINILVIIIIVINFTNDIYTVSTIDRH